MDNIEVTSKILIPRDRIADLLCGALEGGSTYWCDSLIADFTTAPDSCEWTHEAIAHGANFLILHGGEYFARLSPDHGLAMQQLAEEFPEHFDDFVHENDDAITSDIYFQLLCFGEVVYG